MNINRRSILITAATVPPVLLLGAPSASASPERIVWTLQPTDNESTSQQYRQVITSIGGRIGSPLTDRFRLTTPAAPRSVNDFVQVELRSSHSQAVAILYISPQDLYIQAVSIQGRLYTTRDAPSILHPQSTLPFESDYLSLSRAGGFGGSNQDQLSYSGASLDLLIGSIAAWQQRGTTDRLNRSLARFFFTAATMFSEATRFRPMIGEEIIRAMRAQSAYMLSLSDQELIRSWGQISHWGQQVLQNPNTPPLALGNHINVNSLDGSQPFLNRISTSAVLGSIIWLFRNSGN